MQVQVLFVVGLFIFLTVTVIVNGVVKLNQQGGGGPALGKPGGDAASRSASEARNVQELRRGFEDLEKRLESLETILLELARKE